ncbi:unnamed protein product [Paramecium sonneborni]|uniref:Uncharacterized protein n=1 Tax=Paramecium sonneborni TaxID=65129 RepID=A0A8S1QYY1_9CILI|nr:unnamed protein product [Paramecium sonneborni]
MEQYSIWAKRRQQIVRQMKSTRALTYAEEVAGEIFLVLKETAKEYSMKMQMNKSAQWQAR